MNIEIIEMLRSEIMENVNHHIREDGFLLIDPAFGEQGLDDGTLWLANQSGKIVVRDIDIFEHAVGYDLLKPDALFGFNAYVANLRDALLIEAGVDLVPAENIEQ